MMASPDARPTCLLTIAALIAAWSVWAHGPAVAAGDEARNNEMSQGQAIEFERDVRPILSNRCFQCHGPDEAKREASLRLDQRTGAIADLGGHAAIVPGDAQSSELIARVTESDDSLRMPPSDHDERLSETEVALLKRWIDRGAEYPLHWSFRPIERPAVAPPESLPLGWNRNPIDAFVSSKLASRDIEPSPQADRVTLIRRIFLDLLGIPPTPDQVDRFVRDRQVGAVDRLVSRTLRSDRFGERWGRHWLDQARYADSHGYTNDNERSMWPYRDWVIEAFNRDMSFDQFTIQQLAGDLIDGATREQRVATGFHRNTLINSEGGTKADQFRDEQVKDRVDTTGLVWMGLTVGCAKCHTHKFDPITQREYYQLYSFFNSTVDSNSVTPIVQVPSEAQERQRRTLIAQRDRLEIRLTSDPGRLERQTHWEKGLLESASRLPPRVEGAEWVVLSLSGKSDQGSTFVSQDDQSLLVSEGKPTPDQYQSVARSPLTKVRSVRLEVLTDDRLPQGGPGRAADGNFVLNEFWFRTGDGRELRFQRAFAEHAQPGHDITAAIDGDDETGWAIGAAPEGGLDHNRTAWFVLPEPVSVELNDGLTFKMQFQQDGHRAIGRFRISLSSDEWIDRPDPAMIAKVLRLPPAQRSEIQRRRIAKAFVQSDRKLHEINSELSDVKDRIDALERDIPTTMVMQELALPRPTYLQIRGNFLRHGAEVTPDIPAVLPPLLPDRSLVPEAWLESDAPLESEASLVPGGSPAERDRPEAVDQPNRLDLARWLVRPDHPLTARVRVNRIWMRLFGRGLVETENDFGIQGSLPTHPELLDWLSRDFVDSGWSTKRLLRRIMTSATYLQSSHHRGDLESVDPQNRLLARQSRLRVEAEIVRDLALAVSGKLSSSIGGPSVFPPQPDGVYAFTQRKKQWNTSEGEDRFRRGMYTFFYRSAPYPMLSTFDVPKFNTVCTRRDRSNTPLQSLTMSNSTATFELAEYLGDRIVSQSPGKSDRERLAYAMRICFARRPSPGEIDRIQKYLQDSRGRLGDETAAWTAVARVLMNLDEFITRE